MYQTSVKPFTSALNGIVTVVITIVNNIIVVAVADGQISNFLPFNNLYYCKKKKKKKKKKEIFFVVYFFSSNFILLVQLFINVAYNQIIDIATINENGEEEKKKMRLNN